MRFWVILMVLILAGCGGEDEILKDPVPVAKFVSAVPPGGCVAPNGSITVTFDNPPRKVRVDMGTVKVVGKTAIISGPFPEGPLPITLTWADGTQALNYSNVGCHAPCVEGICP